MLGLPPDSEDEHAVEEESEGQAAPPGGAAGELGLLRRLWANLRVNVFPEDVKKRLLPQEIIEVEIQLAWYRHFFGRLVWRRIGPLLVFTAMATGVVFYLATIFDFRPQWALLPPGLLIFLVVYGAYQQLEHAQWRMVKTNVRIIFTIPLANQWPLVDTIDLRGTPAVVDTNWSPSPLWRLFQGFTGARDLYISMVPFQFEKGQAQVKGALVIPDVMPEDVRRLKERIFTK